MSDTTNTVYNPDADRADWVPAPDWQTLTAGIDLSSLSPADVAMLQDTFDATSRAYHKVFAGETASEAIAGLIGKSSGVVREQFATDSVASEIIRRMYRTDNRGQGKRAAKTPEEIAAERARKLADARAKLDAVLR